MEELADLKFWLKFLNLARSGISLHCMTNHKPTQHGVLDSCPFGLGGFTLWRRAWQLLVPPSCVCYNSDSTINKLLKFLAMRITAWLIHMDCDALLGLSK
jgi:hypothetical protein